MAATEVPTEGRMLATISRELVQLHRAFFGKGPTKAKTYAVDDMVVSILREGFTTVERTLIDDGKPEDVERIRRSFQRTMGSRFMGVVERATGRKVIAHMSQVHTDPDLAVQLFMLAARDGEPGLSPEALLAKVGDGEIAEEGQKSPAPH